MKNVINRFRNIKYRWKLFLAMLLVSVVPLGACALAFYGASRQFVYEELTQTKQAQLRQMQQELEGKMQIYEHMADYLLSMESLQEVLSLDSSQLFELYKGYRDVVDPLLETNMYYHPEILQMTIYLMDVDLEHGMTIAPYYTLEMSEWYQNAFPDGTITEKWLVDVDPRMVYYVRPVARYGTVRSVLVTRFDYDGFLAGLETIPTYDNEIICLLSEDRTVLYSNQEDMLGNRYEEKQEEEYTYQMMSIETLGCQMLSAFPSDVAKGSLHDAVTESSLLLVLCAAYAVIVSLVFTKTLVSRTVRLTNIVQKIGERYEDDNGENLAELKCYDGPKDEVGILIENVGGMVERLNELKIAVYKEKIARRDLEMKALQAQINPHFLYNSLSIINWKAIEVDADEVSSITLKLADFYRTTLNRGSSIISVEGEIKNIRSYIDIQLIMHDDNFRVEWDIDESVMNWRMPKLVLQPLVENALEHGLDLKEDEDRLLQLHIREEEGKLSLTVRDNGVGMTQEKADSLIHYDSKGYGVKNVRERIVLLYGEEHIFRIQSREGEGTEIYIRIPGERSEPS